LNANHYTQEFYDSQINGSLASARPVLGLLCRSYSFDSVTDVGCGRGTWLLAALELGAQDVLGVDGSWNQQDQMIDQRIQFEATDLDAPAGRWLKRRADLVISMEVAEHLQPDSSVDFVRALTGISDVVLFSAAFTGQGGENHINERKHSEWAAIFRAHGFVPIDFFRPRLWADQSIEICYRQNAFLYVKEGSKASESFCCAGSTILESDSFMDCIHPELFLSKIRRKTPAERIRNLVPNLIKSLKRRYCLKLINRG
jgi:hypothetical protein